MLLKISNWHKCGWRNCNESEIFGLFVKKTLLKSPLVKSHARHSYAIVLSIKY